MIDKEKVIKGVECCRNRINPDLSENEDSCKLCPYAANDYACSPWELYDDVLALLKEQEEREQAICKEICDFIRRACSTDTDDDKDYVCYVIQQCFTHFGRSVK